MANGMMRFNIQSLMDVSQVKGQIDKIQQMLNGLNIKDTKIKGNFQNTFKEIYGEIDKYQKIMEKGFSSSMDTKNLEKSGTVITNLTNKILQEFEKIENLPRNELQKVFDIDKTSAANLESLNKQIVNIKENLKQVKETSEISNLIKQLDTIKSGKAKEGAIEVKDLIDKNQIAEAIRKLDDLIIRQSKALEMQSKGSSAINTITKNISIFDDLVKNLDTSKLKELEVELTKLEQNRNFTLDKALQDTANNAVKAGQGIRQANIAVEDYVRNNESAAGAQKNLNNELLSFSNRVKAYFGLNNAVYLFQRAIRSAYNSVKELDAAMTETAVVTDFSVGDMWEDIPRYTESANKLGTTILGAYETMTLYYQQGLKTNEVFEIGEETMKMARIAGLDYAEATDLMTAALRGFNMELNETSAQKINDVYSELAAITASNTQEIADAMTRTASISNSAGMAFETTSAFLAQMIETTREAPELIA